MSFAPGCFASEGVVTRSSKRHTFVDSLELLEHILLDVIPTNPQCLR